MKVFISVAGPDRVWARWIGQQLRRAGHTVEYDEWSWQPGTSFLANMEAALAAADRIVAVVSPAYLDRHSFGREEREAAVRLAHTRDGVFVPVLVEPTTLPPLLGRLSYISLVGLGEPEARERLVGGLEGLRPPHLDEQITWPGLQPSDVAEVPFPGRSDGLAGSSLKVQLGDDVREAAEPAATAVAALPVDTLPVDTVPVDTVPVEPVEPLAPAVPVAPIEPVEPDVADRRCRRRRVVTGAGLAVAVATAVAVVAVTTSVLASDRVAGGCDKVSLFTGGVGTPYYRYGEVLTRLVEDAYPDTSVFNQASIGSGAGLDGVRSADGAQCVLAISQLNTAVDAFNGVAQFPTPIEDLRTVGPLGFDLLQLVVRRNSGVDQISDLCGRSVATGVKHSGTHQISEVLFRNLGCVTPVDDKEELLEDGLADLRDGRVDAVLWAGGSPTDAIRDVVGEGAEFTVLPSAEYLDALHEDWDIRYGQTLGDDFVPGKVYSSQDVVRGDYPGTGNLSMIALPNGVVANASADPVLVEFVTRSLFEHRAEFEAALWGTGSGGRRFPNEVESVGRNPVYCLVPLHPVAQRYYASVDVRPDCSTVGDRRDSTGVARPQA